MREMRGEMELLQQQLLTEKHPAKEEKSTQSDPVIVSAEPKPLTAIPSVEKRVIDSDVLSGLQQQLKALQDMVISKQESPKPKKPRQNLGDTFPETTVSLDTPSLMFSLSSEGLGNTDGSLSEIYPENSKDSKEAAKPAFQFYPSTSHTRSKPPAQHGQIPVSATTTSCLSCGTELTKKPEPPKAENYLQISKQPLQTKSHSGGHLNTDDAQREKLKQLRRKLAAGIRDAKRGET